MQTEQENATPNNDSSPTQNKEDDVVDADFEVVDEEDAKETSK